MSIDPPAIADLDGDGNFEIIRDGGDRLYVLEHDGSIANGWPQNIEKYCNNAFSLGDIDSDSLPEIVFGRSGSPPDYYLYALNGDGSNVNGWPITLSSPIVSLQFVLSDSFVSRFISGSVVLFI